MTDEQIFSTITDRDNQRQQAMLKGDIDAVEQYIGSTMRYVHGSGTDEDRTLYMERLRSGYYRYQDMEPIRRDFRRFGDTVIVNGDMRIHVIVNGTEKDFKGRYLQVWVMQDGDWKMIAWQTTPLPAG
ncbi:hypothetical protein AB833_21065 [Chromatiales bacterium (ex Bugula neritina AB1)]|nr:hypothetical protein AB833_21065 [Chromatiales bacterium (ex Bugula neritina AB1)]